MEAAKAPFGEAADRGMDRQFPALIETLLEARAPAELLAAVE